MSVASIQVSHNVIQTCTHYVVPLLIYLFLFSATNMNKFAKHCVPNFNACVMDHRWLVGALKVPSYIMSAILPFLLKVIYFIIVQITTETSLKQE